MLKGIPSILSPELLKILMEMGHGDMLDAILQLFPLDPYVEAPVSLMEVMPGDPVETPIWDEYAAIIEKHEPGTKIGHIERFQFYETAKRAYAIVATGESALYTNIILQKGVVK